MRKSILWVAACAVLMVSCGQSSNADSDNTSLVEDSLKTLLEQKDQTLDELMSTITDINEGFAQINEAEGRVNTLNVNAENGTAQANIKENMEFIQLTLAANKSKIEALEKKVKEGGRVSAKLQNMIDQLTQQLTSKSKDVEELRAELAEKDIQIEALGNSVVQLQEENTKVKAESESNAEIARNQDAQLNTAWYVYGTSRELKEHKILDSGEVLQNQDFDKSYFTKIDIRKVSVIPFGSKSVKVLTNHPEGSYTLLKDSKGEYTLRITDAYKFWSVSKYLVVRVK